MMYMNDEDSTLSQIKTDKLINKYELKTIDNIIVEVKVYKIAGEKENRYVGDFEYKDAQYQIMGVMEKEEFDEIIKNLYFIEINA